MNNHLLMEIGIEELPARFIDDAEKQLETNMIRWLHEQRVAFQTVKTYSTPRRLAVLVKDVAEEQATKTEEVRGPQLKIAKDHEGNWSKAAIGFTKGQGKTVDDIYTKVVNGYEYIFIEKTYAGQATQNILPEIKHLIESIHFPQTMRWGNGSFRYARPIRWIVAVCNQAVIPFDIAGIHAGNTTYGHRFLGEKITISDPLQYEELLEAQYVIADPKKREANIRAGISQLEEKEGFHVVIDEPLLQEVRNLVEYPTVFFGSFEEEYLQVPKSALITSMQEHQRYFPVMDKGQKELLPYFVSVRNGNDAALENVRKGNEKVLRARLADAAFFFSEDKKESIEFYMNKLKTVIFQEQIGTIYEKSQHVKQIVTQLTKSLNVNESVRTRAIRAAEICKFDLMTNMVNEFTELQGIMGEQYAAYFGEEKKVAQAIREHYLPKHAKGDLPETAEGAIVSAADKLDTIVSCFSANLIPSGSEDPHGLRRQAIGIFRIMTAHHWPISFEELAKMATSLYELNHDQIEALQQFFINRAMYLLTDQNIEHDVSQAVLANQIGSFSYTMKKAHLLSKKRDDDNFKYHQEALVRIMNVAKDNVQDQVDQSLFQTDSERKLYTELSLIEPNFKQANAKEDSEQALEAFMRLSEPIHHFFEHNMVMAEDEKIRRNRLALVHQITELILQFADLSVIEWKQHQ